MGQEGEPGSLVRKKLSPIIQGLNENIVWEKIRKPSLIKEFTQAGLEHPEAAVNVVHYLEEHMQSWESKRGLSGKTKSELKAYRFRSKDLTYIQKLTDGILDPAQFIHQLAVVFDLTDKASLPVVSNYIESVKNHPRFSELFTKISQLGILIPIQGFELEESFTQIGDPIKTLLDLPEDEYQRLCGDANFARLREFNHQLLPSVSKGEIPVRFTGLVQAANLEMFLRIVNDPILFDMYKYAIDFNFTRQKPQAIYFNEKARRLFSLVTKVPELYELKKIGFDVSYFCRLNQDTDDEIANWIIGQEKLQATLADVTLCRNTRLMAEYGFNPFPVARGNFTEDFFRKADTETLEKTLIVWDSLKSKKGDFVTHLLKWTPLSIHEIC